MGQYIISAIIYSLFILTFQVNRVSTRFSDNIRSVNISRSDNLNSGDKFNLLVVNSSLCQDQNAVGTELSAQCTLHSLGTETFGGNFCYIKCTCRNETGSFIVFEKRCSDERRLRRDCSLVLGSWSWANGWVWNLETDRLLVLYIEDGFGVQGALNVSAVEYGECTYSSLSTYEDPGVWRAFTAPTNESFVTFFEMRGYWHFFWMIEDLSEGKKSEIEGKFIKLDVTCENSNVANGIVNELSSCLIFKVTGNISHEYSLTSRSTDVYPSTTVYPVITTDIDTDVYPSTTVYPVITTDIDTESTHEPLEPTVTIQEPASSLHIPVISPTSSQHDPVDISSSVIDISLPLKTSSVIKSTPVIINSPVFNSSPAIDVNTVFHSSSVVHGTSVNKNRSMTQPTQATPTQSNDQIGLIIGIVVAGSAAVVIAIAAIVLTVMSLYNSHVKRSQIIQNDATNIHMESIDKIEPTHL